MTIERKILNNMIIFSYGDKFENFALKVQCQVELKGSFSSALFITVESWSGLLSVKVNAECSYQTMPYILLIWF